MSSFMSVCPFFNGACNQIVVLFDSWAASATPFGVFDFNKQKECCLRDSLSRLNVSFVKSLNSIRIK